MPGIMFQEVVCPSVSARRWYTWPLSFIVHTIVIGVLIVAPLVATDVLPKPRRMLELVIPSMPVVPVTPALMPRRIATATNFPSHGFVAPVEAPQGIAPESALDLSAETSRGLEGVIDGLGSGIGVVDSAPPPMREAAPQPVRISRGIQVPARIKDVAPEYPEIARRNRVQGVVILEAVIGVDGRVERARVLRSVPLLDQAALNAVQSWEYTPTLLDGRPVPIIMTVTVNFRLE